MRCFKISFLLNYRARKSDSPGRLREGPITRLCGTAIVKDAKTKPEENEADEDSSQESEKPGNNENSENEAVIIHILKDK